MRKTRLADLFKTDKITPSSFRRKTCGSEEPKAITGQREMLRLVAISIEEHFNMFRGILALVDQSSIIIAITCYMTCACDNFGFTACE